MYDKGDVEEVRKEWQEATQLNPDQLDAHYNLGLSYQKEEEYDLAEKEFREVLRIDSSDADARFSLGEIFDERQDWQSAIREYREVLQLDLGEVLLPRPPRLLHTAQAALEAT